MVQKVFALVMSKGSVKKRNVSNATLSRMVFMKPNHVLDLIFIRFSQISIASSTNQGRWNGWCWWCYSTTNFRQLNNNTILQHHQHFWMVEYMLAPPIFLTFHHLCIVQISNIVHSFKFSFIFKFHIFPYNYQTLPSVFEFLCHLSVSIIPWFYILFF